MNVLIDTSIWVTHFRKRNNALVNLLERDLVLTHPMIIVELACGTPPAPREKTLGDISLLQTCNQASMTEILDFIEREKLYGSGCGFVDMALLASTLITPDTRLWTLDKHLAELAGRFQVHYSQQSH